MSGTLPKRSGLDLRLVALVFAIAVIIVVLRTWIGRTGLPFFADTDDAMRMVMVLDLLEGQGWYDLTAHRLNTPFGAELHWSRLVDLPLAGLLWTFTPLLGSSTALVAAGTIWPMSLLAILLWLSARLTFRLVGPEGVLPALILPIVSPAIMAEFTPGRVDHHSLVIILTLATVLASVGAVGRPRLAWVAGALSATALAIATESLPAVAAAIVVFGLAFVFDPKRAAPMRAFGVSFAAASLIHLAIFRPPNRWLEAACDVISPFYVGVALVIGLVFTLASMLPALQSPWKRFWMLALCGGAGLLAMSLLDPQCLQGPYAALDPWLHAYWIAGIVEAKPWLSNLQDMPAYAVAVGIPVLLATIIVLYRVWRIAERRQEWAVLLVFLVATALVMLAQVRGARLAIMPAIPAAAWLIVTMRQQYLANARLGNVFALLGSWLAFSGIVLGLAVTGFTMLRSSEAMAATSGPGSTDNCRVPAAFADLAGLPPERIMSPIDLGAHIMLYTPHEVVAAPYHRNQQGVRDAFRFFNDPIAQAHTILAERGIGLVVICPGMPELNGIEGHAADSFVSLYAANALPDWLVDVSPRTSPLRIYAVAP